MEKPRGNEDWTPKRKDNRPNRPPQEQVEWIKRLSRASKISYSEDEFYDMLDGEEDARQERDDFEDQDDGYDDFARVSEECRQIEAEIDKLVGPPDAPSYPDGALGDEIESLKALATETRDKLVRTDVAGGTLGLQRLALLVDDVKRAAAERETNRLLAEQCQIIGNRIDDLVGASGSPAYPKGAIESETGPLGVAAAKAREFIILLDPIGAGASLEHLERLLDEVKLAITEREKLQKLEAMKRGVENLANVFKFQGEKLTSKEWGTLNGMSVDLRNLIRKGDLEGASKALIGFRNAVTESTNTTDGPTLLARFSEQIGKGKQALILACLQDCVSAGVDWQKGLTKYSDIQVIKQLLNPPPKPPENFELIDTRSAIPHARERHTRLGIWKCGALLTAHPTMVAIFGSDTAFNTAATGAPLKRSLWSEPRLGRVDAEADGIHYQGVALGNTVALFSFYPVTGKQFRKVDVANLLDLDFEEFCYELDQL